MSEPSPVAAIDHSRRSVSVPRRLMPSILAVHAGQRPRPSAAIAELQAGGIMASERLDPLVTTLVEVMTNPTLVITVELSGGHRPHLATFWGTPHRAVVGLTDDDRRFELIQVEPTLLPFHLAQSTGMRPRPHPPFTGSFSLPATTLHRAERSIASDPAITETELRMAGVSELWVDRLMTALALRHCVWTVESVWLGRTAPRNESRLTVLDAGFAGYWRLAATGDGQVIVATSDFDDLMGRFAALLPSLGSPPIG